jgi:hypothetical protein
VILPLHRWCSKRSQGTNPYGNHAMQRRIFFDAELIASQPHLDQDVMLGADERDCVCFEE